MIVVDVAGVGASRPGRSLFDSLSLTISSGDRIGIVGINGTGKSTLLRVLAGHDAPETGSVRLAPGSRVALLAQEPELAGTTPRQAVGEGWMADAALDRVGLAPFVDRPLDQLWGGQRKRVALARTLTSTGLVDASGTESDLLLLDEPTNHLDLEAIGWLEDRLAGFRGGMVLVTHDRHLLDRVTTRVLELDRGRHHIHAGGYASYLEARAERAEREAGGEAKRRNLARAELAWLRRGAPARTSKPKARIAAATRIVEGRAPQAARAGELDLLFERTPRLGNTVVELNGVGHGWDGPMLFDGVELALDPRERLGLIGSNGVGKSTLLDIIAGRLTPAAGSVTVGATARIGYYDQLGASLDPEARVLEVVAGPSRQPDWSDEALCRRFWFDGDTMRARVALLSGGERRRLQLVATLALAPNVLLLDEPTNDLDLDTLRALEDFLDDWPGALVVASHDRAFLERTVADVLVMDGGGEVGRRPGGLAAWVAEFTARRRTASERPSGGDTRPPRARERRSASTLSHLLRESDKAQARLRRQRDQAARSLEDATAAGDHEALAQAGTALAELEAALNAEEERWIELASEAEGG